MTCTHCCNESKYKCPVCRAPYCSVNCYKTHKQNPCSPPPEPPEEKSDNYQSRLYDYPTDDTVPQEKLKLLEQSTEVKKCLANPHVRKILVLLDQSTHPDEMIQEYMQEPIFTEFVDACLKVVQPQNDNNT
ncbi:zinc finger HIT domain-containing protein 3 [Manduca sexta]|uniref:zinc finger HIT domain-containing protein 3 n=1 Tax=Manduca sexta TaxID=7130 RepID=UPI00188EAE13|nr:zinc finger HIT domain-containing protein 3 [Manduca sexta]